MSQLRLADNPHNSTLSPIRETFKLVKEDPGIANLCIGDPSLPPPLVAVEAMLEALRGGATHYENDAGRPSLRKTIAEIENALRGTRLDPYDNLVVTSGGTNGIYSVSRSVLDPGDEVLLPEPIWIPFIQITRLLNCEPVMVPTRYEAGFVPSIAELEARVTPKTKMLVVVSPGNPTGAIYESGPLREIVEFCERRGIWLLHDEAYRDIVFEAVDQASMTGHSDAVIGVRTVSKSHAMTGLRVGWVLSSNLDLMRRVRLNVAYNTMCACTPSQVGAEAALTNASDYLARSLGMYQERLEHAYRRLSAMGFHLHRPRGSFYLFPRHPYGPGFAARLLREAKVAVVDGDNFGPSGAGHFRVSCAGSTEVLREGLDRIEAWVAAGSGMPRRMSDDEKDGIRGGELADEGAGPAGTPAEAAIRGDGLAEGAGGEAPPEEEIGEDGVRGDGLADEG